MQIPDEDITQVLIGATGEMARDEVLGTILGAAVSAQSNACFALEVVRFVVSVASPDQAMVQICNHEFLNSANFACVFVVFKYFEKAMTRAGHAHVAEYCGVLKDPGTGIIADERRAKAFQDLESPEQIAVILHEISAE